MIKLNGNEVQFGEFPNKEFNMDIKLLFIKEHNSITWDFKDNGDFIKLYTLKSYLDNLDKRSRLYIGYMPYSRMDRINDDYAFSLKFACNMINDMSFYKVTVKEPHSEVTPALLDRRVIHNWCMDNIDTVVLEADTLFFPDAGAQKRYQTSEKYAVGYKKRDFKSGNIESYSIQGDVGESVLIIDDLCSRGGTFIHASKELKKAGAKKVSLLVAHCEENVFTGELFSHIDILYTSKGMLKTKHKQVKEI